MKRTLFSSVFIALLLPLMSCGTAPQKVVNTSTFTSVALIPTDLPIITPSQTPVPEFDFDDYIIVFRKEDYVYFQDGNSSPIKLTQTQEDISSIISHDNQKIVFFREESGHNNIYSINTDGSQERLLVTDRWLPDFLNKENAQSFVPYSHKLLFNTYQCESQHEKSLCAIGLSVVDTNTGEISEIVASPGFGQFSFEGNFKVSPDGKMISVVSSGQIKIFGIDGEVIRILSYTPSTPTELFPEQYWLPDSSGLVVSIATVRNFGWAYNYHPTYAIWRYTIDDSRETSIQLDPAPRMFFSTCGNIINVSPDGNWVLYDYFDDSAQIGAFYLGNLANEHTQNINGSCVRYSVNPWSPDSKHFIYGSRYLGSIDKLPIPLKISVFLGWIDDNHYLYVADDGKRGEKYVAEINGESILVYSLSDAFPNILIIKPKSQ